MTGAGLLVVPGQVLLSPGRRIIVLVSHIESFEPLGGFLDVMVRSLLRDRLGDDSPLPASARIKRVWYRTLTPFLSRSLIHWGEAAVGAGAVTVT